MSEIGLLMTGVLTTGQPSLPNLPEQQTLHLENGLENSIQDDQLAQVVPTPEITPPEFMETDGNSFATPLSLNSNKKNLVDKNYQSVIADSMIVKARVKKYSNQLPIIRFGSSGNTVRVLQRLLISHGYGMRVDGVYGPLTETAVKAFQNRRSLLVDGIVGNRTWRELTI
ncbi:MAG: peptidoglycan-binding domain-containing protein [Aulosira sp. DedQUE10]|nr:peptidoglycan-binding domain-containing protein [Aulosira sp. DedQUE10]